jgi:hypothetical protein
MPPAAPETQENPVPCGWNLRFANPAFAIRAGRVLDTRLLTHVVLNRRRGPSHLIPGYLIPRPVDPGFVTQSNVMGFDSSIVISKEIKLSRSVPALFETSAMVRDATRSPAGKQNEMFRN